MTTLHIDTGRQMRGGQWQALYLLRALAERGCNAQLFAPPGSALFEAATAQQLNTRPLRLLELGGAAARANLIHAHDARAHTLAVLLGRPVVVARRVAFPVGSGLLSRWKYRRARHFIAVSEYVKRTLADGGVDPSKISVIYDGVPVHDASSINQRTNVVALDLDDPRKGKLIVERAAELSGIPIHFSKNLVRDLPQAAVFVYITDLEGLGSAILLAMANGAAVVASRVGGIPEVVEDGVDGLLTSNQPAAVAEAVGRLLADPSLAAKMAARARARVEKNFTVDRMATETLRVYERILA